MKPSTACELAGFALIALAAWVLAPVAGLAVGGVSLLVIAQGIDNDSTLTALQKVASPVVRHYRARKARRGETSEAGG